MSLKDLAEEVSKKQKELNDLLQASGEKALKEELKTIFEKHPNITGIRWKQYAPFFNDGDPCIFHIRGVEVRLGTVKEKKEAEGDDEDDEVGEWLDDYDLERATDDKELIETVGEFEGQIETLEDAMEELFGDHKMVTCTKEAITVSNYDNHD